MKKAIAVSLLLAISLLAVPASASTPDQVTFVSHMSLSAAAGTFEAFGPAVDADVVCPSGDVYDLSYRAAGYQSNMQLNLFVHKLFVCEDGSGTFEMDLNVRIVSSQETTAKWRVVSGDGPYARLHGNGKLTAQSVDEDHLIDTYVGRLHID
jgi:hypothetical protein